MITPKASQSETVRNRKSFSNGSRILAALNGKIKRCVSVNHDSKPSCRPDLKNFHHEAHEDHEGRKGEKGRRGSWEMSNFEHRIGMSKFGMGKWGNGELRNVEFRTGILNFEGRNREKKEYHSSFPLPNFDISPFSHSELRHSKFDVRNSTFPSSPFPARL